MSDEKQQEQERERWSLRPFLESWIAEQNDTDQAFYKSNIKKLLSMLIAVQKITNAHERRKKEKYDVDCELITIPRCCSNCEFYSSDGDTCHLEAPRPILLDCEKEQPSDYWTIFPRMSPSGDWCSKFEFDVFIFKNAPRSVVDGVRYIGELPKKQEEKCQS